MASVPPGILRIHKIWRAAQAGEPVFRRNPGFPLPAPQIDIPTQGQQFLFEKFLIVDEIPYIKGKYGQYLGDDVFLSVQPVQRPQVYRRDQRKKSDKSERMLRQEQIIPNLY